MFEYNPATNVWRKMATCPERLEDPATAAVGCRFYVLNGGKIDPKDGCLSNVQVYDPALDAWYTKGPVPGGNATALTP
jgi:hypothetical protein